ncbi:CD48 antigen isoform X2 [Dipodomys spectabilis]|uniref:CD48 antigen isoform X2 n=1 Tax=Dipodomys spectabilis TaxID=105255 RepID=UPI001C5484DA|nr:CD48 antigen isoform X2 [Dipodomys spectabilis]
MYSIRRNWFLTLDLLLLSLLVTSMQDSSELEKIVLSGSNVTLQISESLPENATSVTWLYTIKQKIVEYERSRPPKYFDSAFKDRVKLDLQNAALHIYPVRKGDNGTYYLRVIKDAIKQWMISLKVLDPVPTPTINIEKIEESDGNCYLKLSCVVEDPFVDYLWYKDSGPFPMELQRSTLEVTVTPHNQSKSYTCQVSNLLSSKNNTLYFTPPCTLVNRVCLSGLYQYTLFFYHQTLVSGHETTVRLDKSNTTSYQYHILRSRKKKTPNPVS